MKGKHLIGGTFLAFSPVSASAAPFYYVNPGCVPLKLEACFTQHDVLRHGYATPALVERCRASADAQCTTSIDLLTKAEAQALAAEAAREQRKQWADWLKTLEETGVVTPRRDDTPSRNNRLPR